VTRPPALSRRKETTHHLAWHTAAGVKPTVSRADGTIQAEFLWKVKTYDRYIQF
jgi:hypothetical protein